MQGEKHERAILKGECPVDIQVSEPLADGMPKEKEQEGKCKFIIELFLKHLPVRKIKLNLKLSWILLSI